MISPCKHPYFVSFRCPGCQKTKKECGVPPTKSLNYVCRNMCVSVEEMNRLRDENMRRLIHEKKLPLLLDLDKTLIHAIRERKLAAADKDYIRLTQREIVDGVVNPSYIQLVLNNRYAIKKRQGVIDFLQLLTSLFEVSIYTMAKRSYAKAVAQILDPYKCIFKYVISRKDCTSTGSKGLDIVLYPERVTVVVDDLREVWAGYTDNLVQIGAYRFFDAGLATGGKGVEWAVEEERNRGDMDIEFLRVLTVLRSVHERFYRGYTKSEGVRKLIKDLAKLEASYC